LARGVIEGLYVNEDLLKSVLAEAAAARATGEYINPRTNASIELSDNIRKQNDVLLLRGPAWMTILLSFVRGRANIELVYQEFIHPEYEQVYNGFIPYMSIIDLIFNCGPNSLKSLRVEG